jgi:hypothetical protein
MCRAVAAQMKLDNIALSWRHNVVATLFTANHRSSDEDLPLIASLGSRTALNQPRSGPATQHAIEAVEPLEDHHECEGEHDHDGRYGCQQRVDGVGNVCVQLDW